MSITYQTNEILISLLKQKNINKVVISSGTRNIPFVNAIENDNFFQCFSVIDERNAAFFALGLAQEYNEAIALACTSGTAASNYLSGLTEAYQSHIPLIAITFDRSPYSLEQLETQKIDQTQIFHGACKKEFLLPLIKDEDDAWYCNRLINEALITLTQHNPGPVHLNIPLTGDTNAIIKATSEGIKENKSHRFIKYYTSNQADKWEELINKLQKSKRVLVVMGQMTYLSNSLKDNLDRFFEKMNCPILSDNLSNYKGKTQIHSEAIIKALNADTITSLLPEIIITFGCNFQERIKDLFKSHKGKFEHWSIEPEGIVRDVFKSQTVLLETQPDTFFAYASKKIIKNTNNNDYLHNWSVLSNAIKLPNMPWSNFFVINEFAKIIPTKSILHLSILNNTRLMQFFNLDSSIKVYSNASCFGIDGCLPTFMGQAFATDELAFLIIGDLSFFYSMNAISIKHRKNNIRILLINNGGGAEFHIQPISNNLPSIDWHIGAAHDRKAKGWAESVGYKFLTANSPETLSYAFKEFVNRDSNKPILLEVFTNMKQDGEFCLSVYREAEKSILPLLKENNK